MMTRRWTEAGLTAAYAVMALTGDLNAAAEATGRFAHEIDRAMWAKVGRDPKQALAILNSGLPEEPEAEPEPAPGAEPPVLAPKSTVLQHFLKGLFGGERR